MGQPDDQGGPKNIRPLWKQFLYGAEDLLATRQDVFWTMWDPLAFLVRRRSWTLIALPFGFFGIAQTILTPQDNAAWMASLSIAVLLLSVDIRNAERQRNIEKNGVHVELNEDFPDLLGKVLPGEGFFKGAFKTGGPVPEFFAYSTALNARLEELSTPVLAKAPRWSLRNELADYLPALIRARRPSFNEIKIRISDELTELSIGGDQSITIERTDYYAGRVSNEAANRTYFRKGEDGTIIRPGYDVAILFIDGDRLLPLSESGLSNHIGITTMVITADDKIVLQTQGEQSIDGGKTNLGGSGSADWQDYDDLFHEASISGAPVSLQAIVRRAMEREAREEVYISPRSSTVLTGYARFLNRGGKPEFFGVTATRSMFDELRVRENEKHYVTELHEVEFQPSSNGLQTCIAELSARFHANDEAMGSLSMMVCLQFAEEYFREEPAKKLAELRARLDSL